MISKAHKKFRVTYEIVTPASAENGDCAEAGFISPEGWRLRPEEGEKAFMTLREAMCLASPQEDCGRYWSEVDGRYCYRTGAVETRAIHPPRTITAASYARVSRILGLKN
jgi:hypothetical protein